LIDADDLVEVFDAAHPAMPAGGQLGPV